VKNQQHLIKNQHQLDTLLADLVNREFGDYGYTVEIKTGQRTSLQNNSMHLFFGQLATALNDAGFDMTRTLREGATIDWTSHSVKKEIWGKVMDAMTGKKSTAVLERDEVSGIYENVNRFIATRTGVSVPFPDRHGPS